MSLKIILIGSCARCPFHNRFLGHECDLLPPEVNEIPVEIITQGVILERCPLDDAEGSL